MKGWSCLNDLGMQLYAYASHDTYFCAEVLRLMHAANHFVYLESINGEQLVRHEFIEGANLAVSALYRRALGIAEHA